MGADGGIPRKVIDAETTGGLTWSRDGARIVYSAGQATDRDSGRSPPRTKDGNALIFGKYDWTSDIVLMDQGK